MSRKAVELERSRTPLILAGIIVFGLIATGGAIVWGTSDTGQINVSATISNSQNLEEGKQAAQPTTPEQQALPNGGLVPSDSPAPTPAPVVEETGTSTEDTETAAEGSVDETPEPDAESAV